MSPFPCPDVYLHYRYAQGEGEERGGGVSGRYTEPRYWWVQGPVRGIRTVIENGLAILHKHVGMVAQELMIFKFWSRV